MTAEHYVADLRSERAGTSEAGGKAKNLHVLLRAGFEVPGGFVVLSGAFEDHLAAIESHVRGFRESLESLAQTDEETDLEELLLRIASLVAQEPPPKRLKHAVESSLGGFPAGARFAVRSSASCEDEIACSWAGIFESYLGLPNDSDVILEHIQKVWASSFSRRAHSYARSTGTAISQIAMSVIVQLLVEDPDFSGVLFTHHPGRGAQHIYLEATEGYGDALVSGRVTPASYEFSRESGELVRSSADILPSSLQSELVGLAKRVERVLEVPQDVEWSSRAGHLHVLQARPVTAQAALARTTPAVPGARVLSQGLPVSPGMASGPVRPVFNIDDAHGVRAGDVIVAPMTNPDMVPFLRKAAGIVTDVGGMICHTAIVAREMGIPCVVGTGSATGILKDLDVVTVDGQAGFVYAGIVTRSEHGEARDPLEDFLEAVRMCPARPTAGGEALAVSPGCAPTIPLPNVAGGLVILPAFVEDRHEIERITGSQGHPDTGARRIYQALQESIEASAGRVFLVMPAGPELEDEIRQRLEPYKDSKSLVFVRGSRSDACAGRHYGGIYVDLSEEAGIPGPPTDPRAAKGRFLILARPPGAAGVRDSVAQIVQEWGGQLLAIGSWTGGQAARLGMRVSASSLGFGDVPSYDSVRAGLGKLKHTDKFFGHLPEEIEMPYPYPPREGPWWPDNWDRPWPLPEEQSALWINIRPEIVNTPFTKSLVVQGVESIPYVFSLDDLGPMYTKWRRCRMHVPKARFDVLRMKVAEMLSEDPDYYYAYIARLHSAYSTWTHQVDAVSLEMTHAPTPGTTDLLRWLTQLWRTHEEFFALCFLIQTIGDDLIWPEIEELARTACRVVGAPSADALGTSLSIMLAHAPEPTLSAEYLDSLHTLAQLHGQQQAAEKLDARGMWSDALAQHLQKWGWMRDRDLLYPPVDSEDAVMRFLQRFDDPESHKTKPSQWYPAAEAVGSVLGSLGLLPRFAHLLSLGVRLHVERENHHVIWVRNVDIIRRIALQLGSYLEQRRVLENVESVFFLQIPEVVALVQGGSLPFDVGERVRSRRTAFAVEAKHLDPAVVGREPIEEADYY